MAKSIIEEALLEAEKLQESLKKNTKEILAATMRQEIDDIVKESFLTEEEEEVEDTEDVESTEELEDTEEPTEVDDSEETEEVEDVDTDDTSDLEDMSDMGDENEVEDIDTTTDFEDTTDMTDMGDDMEVKDMTQEPLAKVAKVFKQMGDNDEIEVVKDGKNLNLKDNQSGAEYIIQLEEGREPVYEITLDEEDVDEGMCNECGSGMYQESDTIYEVELDEEEEEETEVLQDTEEESESPVGENRQRIKYNRKSTFGNNMKTGGMRESYITKMNQLVSENKKLKTLVNEFESKQGEYKNALKIFRDKLNEIALFNTNLTYATKLFTEHSTTKQEKANILKRFDSVVNLKESKNLYKTITDELGVRTPINESVDKKVNKTISKGSVIKESTVYVDPQIKNIQSLMEKLDGRV